MKAENKKGDGEHDQQESMEVVSAIAFSEVIEEVNESHGQAQRKDWDKEEMKRRIVTSVIFQSLRLFFGHRAPLRSREVQV